MAHSTPFFTVEASVGSAKAVEPIEMSFGYVCRRGLGWAHRTMCQVGTRTRRTPHTKGHFWGHIWACLDFPAVDIPNIIR